MTVMETIVVSGSHEPKPKCGARTKQGVDGATCKKPAGWGTDHVGEGTCRLHLGNSAGHKGAARRKMARKAVATYGLPIDVDPHTALLQEVHRTSGHVDWLGQVVGELKRKHLVWGRAEEVAGGKDPHTTHKAGENEYLKLYRQERTHLVRVTAEAIKAGVEERRVRIEEQRAQMLVEMLGGVLDALNLTPEQVALANEAVPRALMALAGKELTT